jgi:alkylation response protein AidB-like acyl-CoA dehydrogenase
MHESIARAEGLAPRLAARADATEQARRLSDDTIADLRAAGLTRLLQPRRFGGAEAPLAVATEVITTLARSCASTAWVTSVYNDHAVLLGKFGRRALEEVWGDTPDALVSAGYAPSGTADRVGQGWKIAGTWGYASGCAHADWFLLGSLLPGAGGVPEPHLLLLPRSDCTIDDNWHVMGLAGTGSRNIVVQSAFVPDHRVLALAAANGDQPPAGSEPGALYRLPHVSTVPFLFSSTALGIAESLLAIMTEAIARPNLRGQSLAEIQSLQIHLAEAAVAIDSARLLIERDTRQAMAAVEAGEALPLAVKARNRRDQAWSVRLCRQAADQLFACAGSRGLFEGHAAQRRFRDICAMSTHIALGWDIAATAYGRVSLGLDPQTFLL